VRRPPMRLSATAEIVRNTAPKRQYLSTCPHGLTRQKTNIIFSVIIIVFHGLITEALRGEEYSSYSFSTLALDGVIGQRHAPAAL
jgi:hypothetical protein